MANSTRTAVRKRTKTKFPRPKDNSLTELNNWVNANHGTLLKLAREHCIRLTGKPTLGEGRRKKSA